MTSSLLKGIKNIFSITNSNTDSQKTTQPNYNKTLTSNSTQTSFNSILNASNADNSIYDKNHKFIYFYGDAKFEGNAQMKNLLGGKGAGLAEMSRIGLPIPPGFTITTEVCTYFNDKGHKYPEGLKEQVDSAIAEIETILGQKFGDATHPLLIAVRSGARVSMPGMMDTILNLGLNDTTVIGLAERSKNKCFAFDSYRRFIQMYSCIVMHVPMAKFDKLLVKQKAKAGVAIDTQLNAEDLKELIVNYKKLIREEKGEEFPQDTWAQLWSAITSVFGSWNNERAITYRKLNDIPHKWGTAVNIVSMVFGNMGDTSATGVAFTRNPATGEKVFFGEYLVNAQGEDVVAGIRTPLPISHSERIKQNTLGLSMEESMPKIFDELNKIRNTLEIHFKEMQDIEFTIENGKLYILQQRSGKRTAKAAVKIAHDMYQEGIVNKEEALLLINASSVNQLLHPTVDPKAEKIVISKGLPASPGAASGRIVLTADEALKLSERGEKVLLVREETSPDDIHGMHAAQGILTSRGGMTSHAAVVCRGMGRPCICGAGEVTIDHEKKIVRIGAKELKCGEIITIDGDTGQVLLGTVKTMEPHLTAEFLIIMQWADEIRRLKVRANAETPKDAEQGRKFGCEGIGLVRTEHMFFGPKRITAVRKMIIAETYEDKNKAIEEILEYQIEDFVELYKIMKGFPVTIRLLDPPLHEFLPKEKNEIVELSKITGVDLDLIEKRINSLRELNPMLGNRGCRLGISRPEITEMQAKAIFIAAIRVKKEFGETVIPEIMVPLAFSKKELDILKIIIEKVKKEIEEKENCTIDYAYGTMIELPRACLVANEIAQTAEFFSFGTNDLTQTTYGISRDDFSFYDCYRAEGVFENDPFATLDVIGVGELMKIACEKGKKTNSQLKLGICGEQGGDPNSIKFAEQLELDYVSCSPYRIPIARLAAAQAFILNNRNKMKM